MKRIRGINPILHLNEVNIFLIGDDSNLESRAKTMLENMECRVIQASSYSEALKKFTPQFDGVLIDVGLPYGNGFEVFHHIRSEYPDYSAVIYVYTAFDKNYLEEEYMKANVHGFISKSFFQDDIKKFVEAVRNKKRNVPCDK